jgi:phage-related holin
MEASKVRDLALLPNYLIKLATDYAPLKAIVAGLAAIAQYVFGDTATQAAAVAAFALLLLDTVTGMVAARVNQDAITSAKFGRFLIKVLGYGSTIIVAAVVAQHVPGIAKVDDSITEVAHSLAVGTVVSAVMVTEAISILENVRKMGVNTPAKWLEKGLKQKLKAIGKAIEADDEDEQKEAA